VDVLNGHLLLASRAVSLECLDLSGEGVSLLKAFEALSRCGVFVNVRQATANVIRCFLNLGFRCLFFAQKEQ
jgi:hypothetical protein